MLGLGMKRLVAVFLVFLFTSFSVGMAAAVIESGHGALLYDVTQASGPDSARTNDPGQWVSNITAFNTGATSSTNLSRLYPYSGDIEMSCTGPSDCIYSGTKQNVFVYYTTASGGYGEASVAAYRAAFPQATILAIIDGQVKGAYLKPLTYAQVGTDTADLVARTICADPNVDGIFFDLEKLDITVPGQFAFYKEISRQFASALCIDANHPTGRVFGAFLSPGRISDWSAVAAAFGSNGHAVVSGYDVVTASPTPVSIHAYTSSVTGMLLTMDAASIKYKIPYTVAIPAASSFSEFTKFGFYDASLPAPHFKLQKDYTPEGITQLVYMQTARAILMAQAKSPYYMGTDYWSWSQYKSPDPKKNQLVEPARPEGEVVTYLQQYG